MVRVPGLASSRQARSASATILPDSRIRPISRADFSSEACEKNCRNITGSSSRSGLLSQRFDNGGVDRLDVAVPRHLAQKSLLLVVLQELAIAFVEHLQPFADC